MKNRRSVLPVPFLCLLKLFSILSLSWLNGCTAFGEEPSGTEQLVRIERAITAGAGFLVKQQDADGAWRSTKYGLLKDGTSLTPLVLSALPKSNDAREARTRALNVLSKWVETREQSVRVRTVPQYPAYTAGLCLQILSTNGSQRAPAESVAWAELLHDHQLTERNGWSVDDPRFGGWGYSHEPPVRPEPGAALSPLDEPNLSATVFALEGLLATDPEGRTNIHARRMARRFVERCQNHREEAKLDDAKFNDGGFHFMLSDTIRNKPGIAGTDSTGELRFVSYGSATADGLRALVLCGVEPPHPRVVAARHWLLAHFEDGAHPGTYPDDRRSLRPSLDFYYAASLSRALQLSRVKNDPQPNPIRWASLLAERLLQRQRSDGAWTNPAVDVREDDPLIATPLALRTLQLCREELSTRRTPQP